MFKSVILICALSCLLLNGCVGTAFLFESEEDLSAPFPDLHSVPPRPPCPDLEAYKQAEEMLSRGHEQAMMKNKRLREQFKLETKTPGESKGE